MKPAGLRYTLGGIFVEEQDPRPDTEGTVVSFPGLQPVRGALDKAGFELISTAMRDCLTGPVDDLTANGGPLVQ